MNNTLSRPRRRRATAGVSATVLLWATATLAAQGPMLRVAAIPGVDQLVEIQTQVRHTTVIVLPENETILDFVVGDSEYWHLTGRRTSRSSSPLQREWKPMSP